LPFYGGKSLGANEGDDWKGGAYMMDKVPTEVRTELEKALTAAAQYIAKAFTEASSG
jgi:hypothetical protein